ncbi:unnamed protein product, partial [Effrenium voratum]
MLDGASSDSGPEPCTAREAWSGQGVLCLAHLTHAVVVPGVEEKLRIELADVPLPAIELRCKAYVGPQTALTEGLDKSRLRKARLEVVGHKAVAEVWIGAPQAEPWAIRIKLYRRPASNLFAQERLAELVEALPRPRSLVQLVPVQHAKLEVLRLVPLSAAAALQKAAGEVLAKAVAAGVEAPDIEKLCLGARELGPETMLSKDVERALESAAGMGKREVVDKLLAAGAKPTLQAAHAAEQAQTAGCVDLARDLFIAQEPDAKESRRVRQRLQAPVLRALEERMPLVAERLLKEKEAALNELPADGEPARKAHAAGAWSVLAALLERGDPMPAKPRLLLDYALRAGHAGLARSCLKHMGEDTKDMDAALRTCLDHGRTEIVREALEVMWKARSSQWSEGPPLLCLEYGPEDQPAECSVCFDPLYTSPGVYINEEGSRVCGHFTCLNCAEHVQDEAGERFRAWRARREPRIPKPPGPACPLCRAPFFAAVRLTDPTVDPRGFFRLACVPE